MGTRHTQALTYSRWERLVFRLTGRWSRAVVARRLDALARDEAEQAGMWLFGAGPLFTEEDE